MDFEFVVLICVVGMSYTFGMTIGYVLFFLYKRKKWRERNSKIGG